MSDLFGFNDPLFTEAQKLMPLPKKYPVSSLQRKYVIGYNRSFKLYQALSMSSNKGISKLRTAIEEFDSKHKRPSMQELGKIVEFLTIEEDKWSEYWSDGGLLRKYAEEPCVYVFIGFQEDVLYVGQTKRLGKRLGTHFSSRSKWKSDAHIIALIPAPKDCWFEILAIEGYLIDKLLSRHA